MCRSRKDTQISRPSSQSSSSKPSQKSSSSSSLTISNSFPAHYETTTTTTTTLSPSPFTSFSSSSLLTSLRQGPTFYPFSELSSTPTTTPLSSSAYRCTLRNDDVVILRRPFISQNPDGLPSRLSSLCRGHHRFVARLLGASLAADHIYLVYKHVPGASLDTCLRNPRNPNFTLLPTWLSRIQILSDLAQALDYIHHHSSTVHNRIKSSSIIVTEPDLRAKLCYFGAAELAGEVIVDNALVINKSMTRTNSRRMRIEGTRGYIAPEALAGGRASQKSDVFAFGVVLLETISGEEPLKYVMKGRECCCSVSVIETAREAVEEGRLREWADQRMGDSFPADVAERVVRMGLRCVEGDVAARPDMVWVAGKLSRLFLESKAWEESVAVPAGISVSFAPR